MARGALELRAEGSATQVVHVCRSEDSERATG